MNKKVQLLSILFLGISQIAFSQIKEEKLVLSKKREPEVKKIEKKKTSVETIKNYPPEEKSQNPVKYTITDVPAVSDFKTSTIQSEDVAPKFEANPLNNYFQIGMGNYGKVLADANISTTLESKTEIGLDAHMLSTNGLKKEYPWKSSQNSANLAAYLNSYGEKGKFNVNVEYGLDNYNYYGIYALQPSSDIDIQQKVNQIKVNGYYDFYSNNILNDVRVKSNFLKDHYDSSESQFSALANLSKHGITIFDDLTMNADLGVGVESIKTDFGIKDKNSATFFNTDVAPKVTFNKGNINLTVGSTFNFLNAKNSSLVLNEQKENKFYWFPKAEVSYNTGKEFTLFGGVDGGLKMNSYAQLLQDNPYVISDQVLKPTETKYHFYLGIKGDIQETIKYNASAGFSRVKNILFYGANPLSDNNPTLDRYGYDYANTFSALYDDGNLVDINANIQYFPLENLMVEADARFMKYDLEGYKDIYNVPLIKGSIGAKYTMLEKKLSLGFRGIFATDRTTNSFGYEAIGTPDVVLLETQNTNDKVGGYADLNLTAEYRFHKNFSIFAHGNNLLSSKYQVYKGYKVLGAQILGGVKITF